MGGTGGGGKYEVEVKAEVDDLAALEAKAVSLGFRLLRVEVHHDVYFTHPQRDFGATDEALRLRTRAGRTVLTYKGPKVDGHTKTREEVEVEVSGDVTALLERLGFSPFITIDKVRRVLSREGDGTEVCLDDVKGLGTFVEIECMSDDVEATREAVLGLAGLLGLDRMETRSYLELILAASK